MLVFITREDTSCPLLRSICYPRFWFQPEPHLIHLMCLTHQKCVLYSFCHCREVEKKQATNSTGHCWCVSLFSLMCLYCIITAVAIETRREGVIPAVWDRYRVCDWDLIKQSVINNKKKKNVHGKWQRAFIIIFLLVCAANNLYENSSIIGWRTHAGISLKNSWHFETLSLKTVLIFKKQQQHWLFVQMINLINLFLHFPDKTPLVMQITTELWVIRQRWLWQQRSWFVSSVLLVSVSFF